MSIVQISKIQQRSGDLVDLPQLDQAELGFASDVNRLFIGKTAGNTQNIEVLTSFSNISFSQLDGAIGNLDMIAPISNGEVIAWDSSSNTWTNRGGNNGGYIDLGEASNVSIDGGALGYILTTDGVGNLSWSPKGTVLQNIQTISATNPGRMTLQQPYPFPQGIQVTINNISGNGLFATNLNGNTVYLKNVPGNLQQYDMYSDAGLITTKNTSTYGVYPTNTGVVIWNTVSTTGLPGGGNRSIQFNNEGIAFGGDNKLLYDAITNTLTLDGTANVSGMINSGNLNVSNNANVGNTLSVTGNANVGNIRATIGNFTGNITTLNANLGNLALSNFFQGDGGLLTNVTANGTVANGTSNIRITTAGGNVNTSVAGNANILVVTGTGANVSGNLDVTTNMTAGNVYANSGLVRSATLQTTAITTGATATAGTITGNWTLTPGSRLQATYADLAEYYAADQNYTPGTVLEFGGNKEVTLAGIESNKVAGVVSTEPAYVMNGNIQAEHPVMIALVGRAPVKVVGHVSKGDMLISAGQGLAKASILTPKIGTVIGKAITNKWSEGEGIVEVMLGRT